MFYPVFLLIVISVIPGKLHTTGSHVICQKISFTRNIKYLHHSFSRERERDRERQRQSERQSERQRQRDRQTDRQREKNDLCMNTLYSH